MSSILRELRKANIVQAYSQGASLGEVWEIAIHENSMLLGTDIEKVNIPQDCKICALVRKDDVYFNLKDMEIAVGDHLVVFCTPDAVRKAEKVFA